MGALCSATLIFMSRDGGESREGAALLAHILAYPLAFIFDWADWGHWASQWTAYIVLAIPLNGLVLGATSGVLVALTPAPRWTVVGALFVAWVASVALVFAIVD